MKLSAGLTAALSAGGIQAANDEIRPIRVGLIGSGGRGRYLTQVMLDKFDAVEVLAVCDVNRENLDRGLDLVERRTGHRPDAYDGDAYAYRRLLGRDDLDAVLIATPVQLHAAMSVDSMKSGKHVGVDVPAGYSFEELRDVVRTKEETGRRYMLLENYCYYSNVMMTLYMIEKGLLGETYYSECAYLHEIKDMMFNPDGTLNWRGRRFLLPGVSYGTHGLGPAAKMLSINDGDRFVSGQSRMTRPRMFAEYAQERFGDSGVDIPQCDVGDVITTTLMTEQGRMIVLAYDRTSWRPNETYYQVQGTRGVYNSRYRGYYLKGMSKQWHNQENFSDYTHPYWRREGDKAQGTGHSGSDYFVMKDFVEMVRFDREPWIDVYDGAAWSSVYEVSKRSLASDGAAVEFPDFTAGKWRDADWRSGSAKPA